MHQDRHGSTAHHLVGDAAEKQSRQSATSMRLQSEQIVFAARRLVQDGRGRMGMGKDARLHGDAPIAQRSRQPLGDRRAPRPAVCRPGRRPPPASARRSADAAPLRTAPRATACTRHPATSPTSPAGSRICSAAGVPSRATSMLRTSGSAVGDGASSRVRISSRGIGRRCTS